MDKENDNDAPYYYRVRDLLQRGEERSKVFDYGKYDER
jgi:hypothetical protein